MKSNLFRVYLLAVALLASVLGIVFHLAGIRTPLGIGTLVAVETLAIVAALALSVREIVER